MAVEGGDLGASGTASTMVVLNSGISISSVASEGAVTVVAVMGLFKPPKW